MPAWQDRERWAQLVRGEACPICLSGGPSGIVAELEGGYLKVDEHARVRGYCCLVAKRHAVELHDLSEAKGAALMRDLQRVSRVVQGITGAIKINHEIHGNTIPHLHVHVIPRYPNDELEELGTSLGSLAGSPYRDGEFAEFVACLRREMLNFPDGSGLE